MWQAAPEMDLLPLQMDCSTCIVKIAAGCLSFKDSCRLLISADSCDEDCYLLKIAAGCYILKIAAGYYVLKIAADCYLLKIAVDCYILKIAAG